MDQAESTHQSVFRHHRERGENANLDRHQCVRARRHRKKRLDVEASLYTILQILSLTLLEKTPLHQLLNNVVLQDPETTDSIQLNLFR